MCYYSFTSIMYYVLSTNTETSPWIPVVQTGTADLIAVFSSIITIVCAVRSIVFLSVGYACGRFSHKHKQSHTSKATTTFDSAEENTCHMEQFQVPETPGPLCEELLRSIPEHQDLVVLNKNVAYGPIGETGQTHAL